ncbi:MAG: hypothetical protein SGBAC_013271 [Bacillariaceae sp.]
MQKKAGGSVGCSVGGGLGADNTDDGVARMPLHSPTALVQADFKGGIFSQKRTILLDQWLKEHSENCLADTVRKTIALKVPTSKKELKEDNILTKGTRRKYGPRIVRVINWFLQKHDIEIGYVKNKRKEILNEESNRRQPKATVNKSSPVIISIDDDSDDANESTNGAINANTTTTVPALTSSKAATKTTPSTNPIQETEYNPFGVDGSKDSGPDKKPEAKITKTSLNRTREQQNVAPKHVAPSPASPLEEASYNPFGDSLDSDNESDEQPKVQIPTKNTKRSREQRNSDRRTTKTPLHSTSFKQQPKMAAIKATKRISRKETSAVSKQIRTSNGTKHISAVAPRNLQYSRLGICDSSDDDERAVPLQSLTNQIHSPSILSTEQTEALDQWILRKAKIRAELEHLEMGNNKIERKYLSVFGLGTRPTSNERMFNIDWSIIPDKARKLAALLVPTSEEDLQDQQIFSDAQRRLYGKFLIWIVREFLEAEKISVAEIRNRRKDNAAREMWQSEKYDSTQIGNSNEGDITVKIAKKRKRENDRLQMSGTKQKTHANSEACQVDGPDLDLKLLEQGYCAEWLNKDGQKLCVYGTVTEFVSIHADDDDQGKEMKGEYVSIEYAEDSRSLLNMHHTTVKNLCILGIEPMHIARAWGGCLLYQEKQHQIHAVGSSFSKGSSSSSAPFPIYPSIRYSGAIHPPVPLRWRVPDLYTRATNFQESAPNMPSLCLHYSGFKLEFTVQPSTILNSGNGVFLSLTSLLNPPPVFSRGRNECATNQGVHHPYDQQRNVPVFSLPPGEVLDIGVYAPLTSQDETPDHIMLVRSFLQSFWCDSYSMNTRDKETVFDITHGRGKLTNEAKKSILPFVNENNQWQTHRAEVQLIDDPQGSFHYVLGYRYDELLGEDVDVLPFRQLADGRPREVFVDYGAQYEMVRLRHGYPRIPIANEAERKKILDEDEREKLDIMFELSAKKLQEAIQCVYEFVTTTTMIELQQRLQELHDDDENDRNNLRERVLAAVVVLQARSEQLRPEVVHQSRNKNSGHQNTKKQCPRGSLRRSGSYHEVEPTNGHNYVDFEGMSMEDWNAVETQLQAIVEKLLPGKSLYSFLSSILKDKTTINDSSLLGMACTIVVTEVKKNSDDKLEGDYVEF